MTRSARVQALLTAFLALDAVKTVYPYQPKDIGALPAVAAGDRAGSAGEPDESAFMLTTATTVTFTVATPIGDRYAGSDAVLAALAPVYEAAGWAYVRDRQVEAQWGDREVVVCTLFLSTTL